MFEITDPRFAARMGAFIDLANQQAREASVDKVSLSMLDATCRYNVWLWAMTSDTLPEFQSKRAEALQFILEQTRLRFEKHYDDYVTHFDSQIVAERNKG